MINMQVRGDRRVVATADGGVEWVGAFAALDPTVFPMLWALDPYGDAVFNHRQVPMLLAELDRPPAVLDGDWVHKACELCQVVDRETQRYLWFVGD